MKKAIHSLLLKRNVITLLISFSMLLCAINLFAAMKDTIILVNRDDCTGCGVCVAEAPSNFQLDDNDGKVNIIKEHPENYEVFEVREAKLACPCQVISTNF